MKAYRPWEGPTTDPGHFMSREQIKDLQSAAQNEALDQLNKICHLFIKLDEIPDALIKLAELRIWAKSDSELIAEEISKEGYLYWLKHFENKLYDRQDELKKRLKEKAVSHLIVKPVGIL